MSTYSQKTTRLNKLILTSDGSADWTPLTQFNFSRKPWRLCKAIWINRFLFNCDPCKIGVCRFHPAFHPGHHFFLVSSPLPSLHPRSHRSFIILVFHQFFPILIPFDWIYCAWFMCHQNRCSFALFFFSSSLSPFLLGSVPSTHWFTSSRSALIILNIMKERE